MRRFGDSSVARDGIQDPLPSHCEEQEAALHQLVSEEVASSIDPSEARRRGASGLRDIAEAALSLLDVLRLGEIRVRVSDLAAPLEDRTAIEVAIVNLPFLVDTLRLNLRRLGLRELLLLHPLLPIERGPEGRVARVGKQSVGVARESYLYCEVHRVGDADRRREIEEELRLRLRSLHAVVDDHGRMVKALRQHTAEIEYSADVMPGGQERAGHLMGFLDWLSDDNFIFLGYRQYKVDRVDDCWEVETVSDSGLGMLRDCDASRFHDAVSGDEIPAVIRSRLADPRLVFFDKSRIESPIHRAGRLDSVSVKMLDENGQTCGFGRILGLLTHKAVRTRASEIPLLRERRDQVIQELGAETGSYSHKAAKEAFDSLPIEFLFPFEVADVCRAVNRIMTASDQQRVEVYTVPDPMNRSFFVSAIMPRKSYDEKLHEDLRRLFSEKCGATYIDSRSTFLDDDIALIHFFCSAADDIDLDMLSELQRLVQARAASWSERFERALLESFGPSAGLTLAEDYARAFPDDYHVLTDATEAVVDVGHLERLRSDDVSIGLELMEDEADGGATTRRLKVYRCSRPYLTDLLPVLDHFGLRVIDATLTEVSVESAGSLWIVAFRIRRFSLDDAAAGRLEARVLEGLREAFTGRVEDDVLNRLIIGAGLDWSEVEMLRTYLAYSEQLGHAAQRPFVSQTLLEYPDAAHALVALFRARFEPGSECDREAAQAAALEDLEKGREPVQTAGEDRVFGLLRNLIEATTRTNFFSEGFERLQALALKLDPSRVTGMPSPVPFAEIFVHAADLAGVHLRGAPIARGGIRWSDRIHDFRTEVLGLMKTQTVKNGLIVPAGAKGGFVLKRAPEGRDLRAEVDHQYERYIRCLLSLTDNVEGDRIAPPAGVVRHDGDDPYLVVAADKGTAHLSDTANRVSEEMGFWLGDAFASGGSEGYDHKKEGITARGAWLCVQRHFRELGLDVERDSYTVAGIGDMSGDVFGNGLLLARRGRLIGAFNHLHIFVDPDPDPEISWAERQRVFDLERSSWQDYDASKISAGGAVYSRTARSIELSPEARRALGVESDRLSGEELVRAILSAPVDLLWNGGIGTYVKASSESHAEVGDRANAQVRVDARDLRARVIGEGGNLGLTQLARVEFALAGGRINTDAIDNSGGVDLSDHEVNLKILLATDSRGAPLPRSERNRWLRDCLEAATTSVLEHNAAQSRSLSLDALRSAEDPDRFVQSAAYLSLEAGLDWDLEKLPSRDELRAREKTSEGPPGFTRPELSVLLGYSKILVKERLSRAMGAGPPVRDGVLESYFPESLRGPFAAAIGTHRLRAEIVATVLCNRVVDRGGATLISELARDCGASVSDVVAAYDTVDRMLESDRLYEAIDAHAVDEETRLRAHLSVERAVRSGTRSRLILEHRCALEPEEMGHWSGLVHELGQLLPEVMSSAERETCTSTSSNLEAAGFAPALAREIAFLPPVVNTFGVLSLAIRTHAPLERVVRLHARVGEETRIAWLLSRLSRVRGEGWDRVAVEALRADMLEAQRVFTERLLEAPAGELEGDLARSSELPRIRALVQQLESDSTIGVAALTVLSRQIRRLC